MTHKHISFSDSIVMRELEKIARKKGLVEDDLYIPQLKKRASATLVESDDEFADIINLASVLRERGFVKQAENLEEKAIIYKSAYNDGNGYSIEERQEKNNEKRYNTGFGAGVLDTAHKPLDLPKLGDLGHVETIEEINKIMVDNTKKTPSGKYASDETRKMVIMAINALRKEAAGLGDTGLEDAGEAAAKNIQETLSKSATDAANIQKELVEKFNTLGDAFKEHNIIAGNNFTENADKFLQENPNLVNQKLITEFKNNKGKETELRNAVNGINSNNFNITIPQGIIGVDFSPLYKLIQSYHSKEAVSDENIQKNIAGQIKNESVRLVGEYDKYMMQQQNAIILGITTAIMNRVKQYQAAIASSTVNTNNQLDLAGCQNIIKVLNAAKKGLAGATSILPKLNLAQFDEPAAKLQELIKNDQRYSGGGNIKTTSATLKQITEKLRNVLISASQKSQTDPAIGNMKADVVKYNNIASIIDQISTVPFDRAKQLYPSILGEYKDAASFDASINAFASNVNEAEQIWKAPTNASINHNNNIKKIAKPAGGNPYAPGGGGAKPAGGGGGGQVGGGGAAPGKGTRSEEIRRMQGMCSTLGEVLNEFFSGGAPLIIKGKPVPQSVKQNLKGIDNTAKKAVQGADRDGLWGDATQEALKKINDFATFAGTDALHFNKPKVGEDEKVTNQRADQNSRAIMQILIELDPHRFSRYAGNAYSGRYLDKLPLAVTQDLIKEDENGIVLMPTHVSSIYTLKKYLESKQFVPPQQV